MIKRIILCVMLSLSLACLLTTVGVLGAYSPVGHILEPASLLCRKFLSSHFASDMDGDLGTAVIWLNLAVYTSLIFPVLMYTRTWVRRRGDAKP
jgi:hypothetical protein